jgi:integrase
VGVTLYAEMGAFMVALKTMQGISPLALQFTILTAARTNEALAATWGEIDLANELWIVHSDRIKARREHRVPFWGCS